MNIPAYASASVSLTTNSNQIIEQKNYSFSGEGTSGSVSEKYLLPSSMNQSMLGTGRIVGSASGTGSSIEGAWATMIYTADPCVANPLHSSSCKGYAFAMSKQLSASNNTALIAPNGTQIQDSVQDPSQPPPSPGSPPPPGSQPPPPPGAEPPPPGTQTAANNPAGAPAANQPPPPGGGAQQPRAGEIKTASDNKSSSSSGPSLGSVMSMISSNQARIGNEARAVVQAAESQAATAATAAQQQAESVAGALTAQSIASSMTQSTPGATTVQSSSMQLQMSQPVTFSPALTSVVNIGGLRAPSSGTFVDSSVPVYTGAVAGAVDLYSFQLPQGRTANSVEPDVLPAEGIRIGGRSALNDAIEQRAMLQTTAAQEQKTDAVNKNAQPNEVAGRVDVAAMATQPVGYQAYSFTLADVPFYAPREIYRNQRTVDNARAQRLLQGANDQLHQGLVNLQYK